jgi:hypothetical protein
MPILVHVIVEVIDDQHELSDDEHRDCQYAQHVDEHTSPHPEGRNVFSPRYSFFTFFSVFCVPFFFSS